ncbi:hypothetical protein SAMN05443245_4679 [Paraburkholderia fungorum]|uniref:Alpha/beta hydrolase n=1 Tax=Paraburkholderia fungorum TaxID=134537 RepID=A0A1H1I634_9BURK|nr:hypothetical protein [Paraburkholderia fungorum]SDR32818.1 hypothetical protein SAMN05443245_4679 [Paraburkholderia fungorum]
MPTMLDYFAPSLASFEVQRAQVAPMLAGLRFVNSMLDFAFYDVPMFKRVLEKDGVEIEWTDGATGAPVQPLTDLSALMNPEGSILVIDAANSPHIRRFSDVETFLEASTGGVSLIDAISVSGVGSSALGSAALAWNASTALEKPVAAIVPGYGLADVIQQALGGWFGFEMYSYWIKQPVQNVLAQIAPGAASVGRNLLATTPGHAEAPGTQVPVFRHGSGSSDVLHAILEATDNVTTLLGHSKGALVIQNAIADIPAAHLSRLHVMTFGCVIPEDAAIKRYDQFLGTFDALGFLNSGGNWPEHSVSTWHSTNTVSHLSMRVSTLAKHC